MWVLGPFLRAKLLFAEKISQDYLNETKTKVLSILSNHKEEIMKSPWRVLTELTNKNGAYCSHSCPTQAWSAACLLEVLFDLQQCSQ